MKSLALVSISLLTVLNISPQTMINLANSNCSDVGNLFFSACASEDQGSIDVSGVSEHYGDGGSGGASHGGESSYVPDGDSAPSEHIICTPTGLGGRCMPAVETPTANEDAAPVVAAPPTRVTASDLANVAPIAASISMQPEGMGLLNKPMNFWVNAQTHTKAGTLLGHPMSVTFTPAQVTWNYGDGSSQTTNSMGSSWDSQGLPWFSETATSHVYTQRGSYVVSATIHYSAVVSVGGNTINVTGYVSTTSVTAAFELYEVSPVLVPAP